jgi:hypothetical protein
MYKMNFSRVIENIRRAIGTAIHRTIGTRALFDKSQINNNLQIWDRWKRDQNSHPNPLNRFGQKCFSQTDEDGITLEIVRRLGLEVGTFAEIGAGDGLANNTLILLAMGWKGFWLGDEELKVNHKTSPRLEYFRGWISLDNLDQLMRAGMKSTPIDVLSLDLDGNDIYFADHILKNFSHPALFIVETNAKFLPPVRFSISYDKNNSWQGDDYYGASLQTFTDLFAKHDYFLACCNSGSGANAFFIRDEFRARFAEVPKDIRDIYVPPNYSDLTNYGHRTSVRTINRIIR